MPEDFRLRPHESGAHTLPLCYTAVKHLFSNDEGTPRHASSANLLEETPAHFVSQVFYSELGVRDGVEMGWECEAAARAVAEVAPLIPRLGTHDCWIELFQTN